MDPCKGCNGMSTGLLSHITEFWRMSGVGSDDTSDYHATEVNDMCLQNHSGKQPVPEALERL